MAIRLKSSGKSKSSGADGGGSANSDLIAAKQEQKQLQQQLQQAKKEAKVKLKQVKKDTATAKKEQRKAMAAAKKEQKIEKQKQKLESIAQNPEKLAKKMKLMMLILLLVILLAVAAVVFLLFFGKGTASNAPLPKNEQTASDTQGIQSGNVPAQLDSNGNALDSAGSLLDSSVSTLDDSPGEQMQAPRLEIDRVTLELPDFVFSSESSLEAAVHRDIHAYLLEKDDRPGVQFEAISIVGQYTKDDGTLRVLTYVWGNRYAVSQNTFIEYGSLAGPVALDYERDSNGGYVLQKLNLARSGDAYEDSVMDMCGPKTEVGKSIIRKEFDVELHMQMSNLVSSYITQNNVDVDFYSVGGEAYNRDGTFYVDPTLVEEGLNENATDSASVEPVDPAAEYDYIRSIPQ